jgi:hypothetical protein
VGEAARPTSSRVATAILAVAVLTCPMSAEPLEVDSYYAWGREIRDSSDVVDAKFDLEIQTALAELASHHRGSLPSCDAVAHRIRARLELEIFHPIGLWARQSPLLDRVPANGDEELRFRSENLYADKGFPDIGMWMPISPVIRLDGVVVGIDKLEHFVSSGWKMRNAYMRARREGHSVEEAVHRAIRWGILEEQTINGKLSTGVLSQADVEANFGGMRFYVELCEGEDPMLALVDGVWTQRRGFDIRRYVTPEWDEAFQPSAYTTGRWRHVRPRLITYCSRLADPDVQELLARYCARDTITPVEAAFAELVAEGKVQDPYRFSLEANCPNEPATLTALAADVPEVTPAAEPPPPDPAEEHEITRELVALDSDRPLHTFGLLGAFLDRPMTVSGAIGALFAHPRATDDCLSVCTMTGPYLQAEAGLHGAQIGLGYTSLVGETGSGRRWITSALLGVGVEAAVLKTWSGSPLNPESQTLAGIEGQLAVAHVGIRLGAFSRISHADSGGRWVVTAALGWGY